MVTASLVHARNMLSPSDCFCIEGRFCFWFHCFFFPSYVFLPLGATAVLALLLLLLMEERVIRQLDVVWHGFRSTSRGNLPLRCLRLATVLVNVMYDTCFILSQLCLLEVLWSSSLLCTKHICLPLYCIAHHEVEGLARLSAEPI